MTASRTILVTIDIDVIGGLRWEDRTAGVEWSTGRYGPALTDERDERRMWAVVMFTGLGVLAIEEAEKQRVDRVDFADGTLTITGPANHPLIAAATGTTTGRR